jgi:hypothetical protein
MDTDDEMKPETVRLSLGLSKPLRLQEVSVQERAYLQEVISPTVTGMAIGCLTELPVYVSFSLMFGTI